MAYNLTPITVERVEPLLRAATAENRALRQPEILDALRGPLEYYEADVVDDDGTLVHAKGDVVVRPHQDLEAALVAMRHGGLAFFSKADGGWRLRV